MNRLRSGRGVLPLVAPTLIAAAVALSAAAAAADFTPGSPGLGDPVFFRLLRDWATQNRHGNVSTAQFVALAEQESGLDLDHFFDVWLYQPDKPTSW